jgi:hypothetical protein
MPETGFSEFQLLMKKNSFEVFAFDTVGVHFRTAGKVRFRTCSPKLYLFNEALA